MTKLFSAVFLLLYLSLSLNAQTAPALPALHPNRVPAIDISHIKLQLQFDFTNQKAFGTATIKLHPFTKTDKIFLDAANLSINNITLQNGKALTYVYDGSDANNALQINLDKFYSPSDEISITINYSTNYINLSDPINLGGSNGKGLRFFKPTTTEPRKRYQVWSMAEYHSNRYWFPGYDDPEDLRTTEIFLTVDTSMVGIANGRLQKTINNHDGTNTYQWIMDTPYPNYQTAIVIGKYHDIGTKINSVEVHNYAYPDEIAATKASIARLPDMFDFYAEYTAHPFPFKNYNQVFVQDLVWGMASAGTSIQTENMVDDYGTHADFFYLWDGLEAEALAQQWFGTLLSPASWNDIWLSRGFAHYFDALFNEYINGTDEMLLWNHLYNQNVYLGDWYSNYKHPIVTANYDDEHQFVTDNYAYTRGALVLHMLRKQIGENNWQKGIQYYVKTYAGKQVTTENLRTAFLTATQIDLTWFFDQWIYGFGHPVFEISQHYNNETKRLTLNLTQTQQPDTTSAYPQVNYFQGKMEIEINDSIYTINLLPQKINSFIFMLTNEPQLVNTDYQSTWIKEFTHQKSTAELIYQFKYDKDVLGRQWALTELSNILQATDTPKSTKQEIFTAFHYVITDTSYWRLRYNVLTQLKFMLPNPYNEKTISLLTKVIKNDTSWIRAAAISMLGNTKDSIYCPLYEKYLSDVSDRVINAAANAMGKTKSADAFDILVQLKDKPSWKNQSLISTLNGLRELGDSRGIPIALAALSDSAAGARWTLATPVWDYRLAAAYTLVALNAAAQAYPIVLAKFLKSLEENDVNDIFSNVLLINTLAVPQGKEIYVLLKEKYKQDENMLSVVNQYETQFLSAIPQ